MSETIVTAGWIIASGLIYLALFLWGQYDDDE